MHLSVGLWQGQLSTAATDLNQLLSPHSFLKVASARTAVATSSTLTPRLMLPLETDEVPTCFSRSLVFTEEVPCALLYHVAHFTQF